MKTVQLILNTKNVQIFSVQENASVLSALTLMMEKNISALLVMNGQQLAGIFTERDYARKIVLLGRSSAETVIKDVMTANPIKVQPMDSIELCMQLKTEKHIRHLPVVLPDNQFAMISIGDLVKFIIADQQQTIAHLESYINS